MLQRITFRQRKAEININGPPAGLARGGGARCLLPWPRDQPQAGDHPRLGPGPPRRLPRAQGP
eukprot:13222153-Alexandrium_andersonii.AAC.2